MLIVIACVLSSLLLVGKRTSGLSFLFPLKPFPQLSLGALEAVADLINFHPVKPSSYIQSTIFLLCLDLSLMSVVFLMPKKPHLGPRCSCSSSIVHSINSCHQGCCFPAPCMPSRQATGSGALLLPSSGEGGCVLR